MAQAALKEEVRCPICESVMNWKRGMGFWKCPTCKHELWPPGVVEEDEEAECSGPFYCATYKEARELIAKVSPLMSPLRLVIPPGGSKKAGRKRNKTRPLSFSQRYKLE